MAYSTTFPLTENPISEGGVWLQHNTNRAKVLTTGGNAFGTGTNNDGYAYLAGAGDSVIETTVFRDATLGDADPNSYEIEHLHRLTDDAGNTTCYELDFSYTNGFNIVRWSGATSFAVLSGLVTDANFFPDGGGGQLRNGHKIKSECVLTPSPRINIYADTGSGYTLFFHYVLGADATNDNPPLTTGDPAISFFTTIGSSNLFGMSDATITSLSAPVIVVPTTSRAGRGPGQGPRLRRMAPQQFPTPAPTDTVTPTPIATPFHIGGGTSGKGIPQRRRIPQQFPDTIPFVPDGSGSQTPFRIGRGGGIGTPTRRMFPQQYPTASAITTTLAPSEGSIVIAGAAASITLVIAAIAGAIIIAGNAPSITTSLQATEGAIVISGNAASTTTTLAASAGTVIIGGAAPSLGSTLVVTDGSVIIGGNAPSIGAATFSPTEGAITIDGNAPSITLTIPAAPIAAPGGGYAGVRGAKLEWREWETLKKKRKEVERKAPQVARIIEEIAEQNFDLAPALKALSQQLDEENLRQAKIYRELMKLEIERNRFTAQLSEDDDEEAITLLLNG